MSVSTPSLPPLLCMKSGKTYSLYTYKNGWNAELGRSYRIPGSTKAVGKIKEGASLGEIVWKDDFIEQHPELNDFIAFRNGKGTIEFKQGEDTEKLISLKEALNAKRYAAGATWVFDNLIADTPLSKALKETFGTNNINKKILSLAYFLNISDSNVTSRYEVFADTHRLPWQKTMTASAICRLFQNITSDKIDQFMSKLSSFTKLRDDDNNKTEYYALDSTSISTYSQNLSKAEYGHNKDGDKTPQINVLMVVNQLTGEPVYYRTYSGNIPDMSTVKHYLNEMSRLELNNNAVLVADKGYSNIRNIHRFYQSKVSFLLNMRTSFAVCKNLFNEARIHLFDPITYDESIGNNVYTTEINWSYPINFKHNCKRTPREKELMFVHIYYSREIYNAHEKTIHSNIAKVAKMLQENKPLPSEYKYIKDTFLIENKDEENDVITYSTNRDALDKYLQMKGVRILVSDTVKDPIEAYKAYFDRNEVEYAFNLYKQRLSGTRMRVSSNASLEGKSFVQFIATSLAIMLRKRINNALKNSEKLKLRYDSEQIVIDKLDTIEVTKFELGSYYSEVVGPIKDLLNAMNIPIPSEEVNQEDYEEDTAADEEDLIEDEIAKTEGKSDFDILK